MGAQVLHTFITYYSRFALFSYHCVIGDKVRKGREREGGGCGYNQRNDTNNFFLKIDEQQIANFYHCYDILL